MCLLEALKNKSLHVPMNITIFHAGDVMMEEKNIQTKFNVII